MTFTWGTKVPSLVSYADGEDLAGEDEVEKYMGKALAAQYLGVGDRRTDRGCSKE